MAERKLSNKKAEEINGSTEDEKPVENGDHTKEERTTKKEDENEDGDNGESSEEELGSLEKPLIVTTKRERKSVEIYVGKKREEKEKKEFDYSMGKGIKLGDIPIVKHNIDRADIEDLQVLHRLMYSKKSKKQDTKNNLCDFCGWPFDKDTKEYRLCKFSIVDRLYNNALKWTLDLLGLEKSGKDAEAMRDALCEFLLEPVQNDKEVPSKRKSEGGSKSSSSGRPRGRPKNSESTTKSKPKKKSEDSEEDQVSDVSEASGDNGIESEEQDEEKPKKKTPKTKSGSSGRPRGRPKNSESTPKNKPKKISKDSEEDEVSDVSEASGDNGIGSEEEQNEEQLKKKTPNAKSSSNGRPRGRPKKGESTHVKIVIPAKKPKIASKKRKPEASNDSSEDEEPLVKKTNAPPTDDELKNDISVILKDADLLKVTMKNVVCQIYDKYSLFDLSSRKDFIKTSIRDLIS